MNEHQIRKYNLIPDSKKVMYKKAVETKSPRKAIRIFCLECCGFLPVEVNKCTSLGCPLYPYRQGGWPNRGKPPMPTTTAPKPNFKSFKSSKK